MVFPTTDLSSTYSQKISGKCSFALYLCIFYLDFAAGKYNLQARQTCPVNIASICVSMLLDI